MRFIISSGSLLKILQLSNGIIGGSVVVPILENFLFDLKGNQLTITGADMETMIKASIEVQVAEDNDADSRKIICVPAKILTDYLKNLPEQPLNIAINEEDKSIELTSNTGRYKIGGIDGSEYPKQPEIEAPTVFNLNSQQFTQAIVNTIFATSNDNLRPSMTGVYFEFKEGNINFVATDAHRLVKFTQFNAGDTEEGGIIVPKKPLQQLKNMLGNEDVNLQLSFTKTHLYVQSDTFELNCRLIDGKFPPYQAVIPVENPFLLVANRTDLLGCLRRLNIFSNKGTSQVVFDITGSQLQISAQDSDFSYEGNETIECQYNGEDMKIGFNSKLLIEMLNNMDSQDVKVELSIPSKAGIFRPSEEKEENEILMLLMPLMVGIQQ